MNTETIIHSNGSKWYGQEPDSIDKLKEVLKTNTIEERFFHQYRENKYNAKEAPIYKNICPISKATSGFYGDKEGMTIFFGNFEEVSHVFRIATNDPKVINELTPLIKSNKGWLKYYEQHLVK